MQNAMRKSKLTNHVIKRTSERVDLNGKTANKQVREMMQYGLPPGAFTGDFYSYLHYIRTKKYKSIGVRVMDNYILLYNKNSRRAITLYAVPEKFLPVEQYILSKNNTKVDELIREIKEMFKDKVDIHLQVLVSKAFDVTVGLSINNEFICFGSGASKFEAEEKALQFYLNEYYPKNKK